MASAAPSPEPSSADRPWIGRPLAGLSLALLAGAAFGLQQPWQAHSVPLVATLAAGAVALLRGRGRAAFVAGLALAAALGLGRAGQAVNAWERQPLRRWVARSVHLEGRLIDDPEARQRGGQRAVVEVSWLAPDGGPWRPMRGLVRLNWDQESTLAAGERVRFRALLGVGETAGNPGQFSGRRWLRRDGLAAEAHLDRPPRAVSPATARGPASLARALRLRLVDGVRRTMPGPAAAEHAALLGAMVFGDTAAPIDASLQDAFRRAGVVHVLVASGTQVSLLLALIFLLGRGLAVPGWMQLAVATPVIAVYSLMTGAEPSILRAAVMGWLIFAALAFGQDHDLPTALAVSAALLVLQQPLRLESIGFQLSFAAALGITLLGLPLAELWRPRLGRLVGATAAMTIAAQAYTAPLLIYHFRQLALVGPVANLPVVPLSGGLVVTGLAQAGLAQLWTLPAGWLGWLNQALLSGFVGLVGWFSRLPGGYREPFLMTPLALAGLLAALGWITMSVAGLSQPGRRVREAAVVWLLAIVAAGSLAGAWRAARASCTVTVLDVGQGDSILIRGPGGQAVLVDGGPAIDDGEYRRDAGREAVVPALMLLGVRRLSAVIGTHRHVDHIGGLASVVEAFPIERLLLPELPADAPAIERLEAAATARGITPTRLRRGDRIELPGGVGVFVLWPPARPVRETGSDTNNNAVVLKVVYGATSWLLASDLERAGEKLLLRHAGDLSADVLKVPHQGSADACSDALLDAVAPSQAVISCGPNVYGHPDPGTLGRLASRGIAVARTDRDGMVTYRSDGRTITESRYGRR